MRYLLDTGILLRLINRQSAEHEEIRRAVRTLKIQGHATVSSFQNRAEFWNVCTRPSSARGGLGLDIDETRHRLRAIERIAPLLPDVLEVYEKWRELVCNHHVQGVQVHDAKLVALMMIHGLTHLLTLNPRDFQRFPDVAAVHPSAVVVGPP
jgi:predicted nucleic acid-binding protein